MTTFRKGLRSRFYTSYEAESAMLPTITQKIFVGVLIVVVLLLPFGIIPGLGWVAEGPQWFRVLARMCAWGIAGLGLNLLTGFAGQVSLGHAFFMGVGAYTAVALGSEGVGFGAESGFIGFDLPMWIWLPMAAIIPAIIGAILAPIAVRVRGLYLAFVTIGLVFIGQHIFRNIPRIAGDPEGGRAFPELEWEWWRGNGFSFTSDTTVLGITYTGEQVLFFFMFVGLVIATIVHKNLARTRTGRAWAGIRDRDIAAEVMGIPEARYKTLAFAISSAYAGVGGALYASLSGTPSPAQWDFDLAVAMIAIVLIGGAGTTAGPILGALFVVLIPEFVEIGTEWLGEVAETGAGISQAIADFIVATSPADSGLISLIQSGPGISVFDFNNVLYGLLIVLFLIFEPLGLYGIWINIRNYWKGWPFTY